jgi:molybdopterin converting factor subunit 1
MRVRVLFFGVLKDVAGKPSETVELHEGATVGDFLTWLETIIPAIKKFLPSLAIAVNQEYAKAETRLKADDEIALLPPVSGGRR